MAQVTLDVYELLKKGGGLLQYRINNLIQNHLNNYNLIGLVNSQSNSLSKKITAAKKYAEQTSSLLNLPTKIDLSNATQLILQSEEKIDKLDEQLYELTEKMAEIKSLLEEEPLSKRKDKMVGTSSDEEV